MGETLKEKDVFAVSERLLERYIILSLGGSFCFIILSSIENNAVLQYLCASEKLQLL